MLILAGLVGSSFIVVSLVVGARLLLLGLRSGRRPELSVGLGLFAMGGFSWPLIVVGHQAVGLADGIRGGFIMASVAFMAVGQTSFAWFTWRVFRPEQAWARWLAVAVAATFVSCLFGQAVRPGYTAIALEQQQHWLLYRIATVFVLAWTGVESLRYARISARRQRIGLSDPVVTNRFVLWAGSTLTCALLALMTTIVAPRLSGSVIGVIVTTPVSLAAAVGLWLAFLPPAFYSRWLTQSPA